MRILIAEDDLMSSKLLSTMLSKWGYEVIITHSGYEAWESFKSNQISMVISDWMMPEMNGIDLLKKIRNHGNNRSVYFIILSSKLTTENIVEGIETGADDYITKPFKASELKARINAGKRITDLENTVALRNKELTKANKRMRNDLKAAGRVQKSLMPEIAPSIEDINFSWEYLPCEELAGDIFNYVKLDDNHYGIYLLDVSGHGVRSSLLAVTLNYILTNNSEDSILIRTSKDYPGQTRIRPPDEVMRSLNNRFPMDRNDGIYFTIIYGVLNTSTKQFCFSSAGHPWIFAIIDQTMKRFSATGMPIGFSPHASYKKKTLNLAAGDRLLLFSDGIPECLNGEKNQFGYEKIEELFFQLGKDDMRKFLKTLMSDLGKWNQGTEFKDDITIFGIEVK